MAEYDALVAFILFAVLMALLYRFYRRPAWVGFVISVLITPFGALVILALWVLRDGAVARRRHAARNALRSPSPR